MPFRTEPVEPDSYRVTQYPLPGIMKLRGPLWRDGVPAFRIPGTRGRMPFSTFAVTQS